MSRNAKTLLRLTQPATRPSLYSRHSSFSNSRLTRPISNTAIPWICKACIRKSTAIRQDRQVQLLETRRSFSQQKALAAKELPSHEEKRRSHASKRFSSVMDNVQANIFFAGQRLNDLTGYSGIEALKRDIEAQEQVLRTAQTAYSSAKLGYSNAITQRRDSQMEVNELLQRKNSWSPQDLERFTALYRSDHENEMAENTAKQQLDNAEKAVEEASARLTAKILARYHEEQIWSDKIRRMSTWGTWGLMGFNVLLFLVFQVAVEPWRRQRLVKGFEDKVQKALEDSHTRLQVISEPLSADEGGFSVETSATDEPNDISTTAEEVIANELAAESGLLAERSQEPASVGQISWRQGINVWYQKIESLFSDRQVNVRQVDLTQKALEGMFVGVMITSIIATLVRGS